MARMRFCFGTAWCLRPDFVYDKNPSPNFQRPTTETSHHYSFRLGISRFLGRGHGTRRAPWEIADNRPRPAPTPPPAQQPPPAPPPPPAPTANLTANPSSIM